MISGAVVDFCIVATALLIAWGLAEQMVPWFITIFISCSEIIKHYYNIVSF